MTDESVQQTAPRPAAVSRVAGNWELIRPLRLRNFRLLWVGSVISMVGSNLTMIAFPWLVLKLTGDPLAMGVVLAVSGVPRAVFMIFGGALTDRFSARTVMLWSTWVRMIALLLLAALVYTEVVNMWMVYTVSFVFGVVDAFAWPASSALMPKLVPPELLPPANALLQGFSQLSVMLGPVLAGVLIAMFSTGAGDRADLPGLALVFFLDGLGFVVAGVCIWLIRSDRDQATATSSFGRLFHAIAQGFVHMWQDLPVRIMVLVFSVFALFFRGPYMVGIPVLCDQRFDEGALAFGMISSAFGLGALVGIVAAGSLRRPPERWYGRLLLADLLVLGGGLFVYAQADSLYLVMVTAAVGGLLDGYMMILLISWLQARIASHLMGRVMSVIMFFNSGLAPISYGLSGALIRISLDGVFMAAGGILVALAVVGFLVPTTRTLALR
ncbi:MAG: MFS transporter [Proteobacteria bacterium]|nr:MFS transporter [Pseudomonadota bacterium]MDA1299512.1 MFS transporter [Pseudomonadota bacterium]